MPRFARLLGLLLVATSLWAASPDDIQAPLADRFPVDWLQKHLATRDTFHPYPTAAEPESWGKLDPVARKSLLAQGVTANDGPWDVLPASVFLDFARNGNRSRYEDSYFARRERQRTLVLAETVAHQGQFLDQVMNGSWAICEETSWSLPAHEGVQKAGVGLPDAQEPILDLFAAETGAQLAWTQYLLGPDFDKLSPLINPRVTAEIERRIITPFLTRSDFGWMGLNKEKPALNNWTPWITSNILTCLLLVEKDESRRVTGISKALRILDLYLASQPADGGCDEGPVYWSRAGASTFDSLDLLLLASHGDLNGFSIPKVRELGKYIYRVQIAGDWVVNFADAAAKSTGEGGVIYRYGVKIQDPDMMRYGAWLTQKHALNGTASLASLGRLLPNLLQESAILLANAGEPLPKDVWFPNLQVAVARAEEGSTKGLFLAAKGGHNAESHNHNDVGSCIVFADGEPVLIDAGVETYTRKTFSKDRYTIWTMQSAYHNLPTINGVNQSDGREFAARDVRYVAEDATTVLSLDIAAAYPKAAEVTNWVRSYVLHRPDSLTISDDYAVTDLTGAIERHFLLAVEPKVVAPGTLQITEKTGLVVLLKFDGDDKVAVEAIDTSDPRLHAVWGDHVYRATITEPAPKLQDHLELTISIKR